MNTNRPCIWNSKKLVFLISGSLVVLDQAIKFYIQSFFSLWEKKILIPDFLNLVLVYNRGAAFGFLNNSPYNWPHYFLMGATLIAIGVIIYLLLAKKYQDCLMLIGLSLILGGALGNLLDRIRLGSVVDYIDLYLGRFHWPAFNLADLGITTGAFIVLISIYRQKNYASDTY